MKNPTVLIILLSFFTSINAQILDIPEDLSGEVWKIICPPNTICKNTIYKFQKNNRFEMNEWFDGSNFGYVSTKGNYRFYQPNNEIYFIADSISIDNIQQALNSELREKSNHNFKLIQQENDSIYSIQKFTNVDSDRDGKRITTREVYPVQKIQRTKPTQQNIEKLLAKLNSWVANNVGANDVDAYERPYAHPNYISSGETNAWVNSLQRQIYQLGATIIWNEKKKIYELETNQHLIARSEFVEVYVAKTLYQSEKAPAEYFLKIIIKNTGKEMIGFNLSHQANDIFFANQWGKYAKPFREEINERRIVLENKNLTPVIQQFKDGLLQTIKPNEQLDYYINVNDSNSKLILDDKTGFFIVTIDGQMKFTDGKTVELISMENQEDEVRAIVFPMPANIETATEKRWIFLTKAINERGH